MTVFSGKDGSLEFGNQVITRVRNWTLNSTFDTLEVTDLGDTYRQYRAGLKGASGSATLYYHDDDDTVDRILNNCITEDEPTPGNLSLKWGDKEIAFRAWINQVSITCSTGEVMSAAITFTMQNGYTDIEL